MKISIITVCFNSAATIQNTIESVLSQTYSDIEYIIVDGASTDGTVEIVRSYGDRISRVISEPDQGIYDAMNKGVAVASGDIIGILNSDDIFEDESAIKEVIHAFEQETDLDLVFGDVVYVDRNDLSRVTRYYAASHFRPWKMRFGWMPPHPATFVRHSVYQRCKPYRVDMKISADFEMLIRLFLVEEVKFKWIDRVLVRMRSGGVSTSGFRASLKLNREIVQACRQNGIYTNLLLVGTKLPFKLIEYYRKPPGRPA